MPRQTKVDRPLGALAPYLPITAMLGAMTSYFLGTSVAKGLFPVVGAAGTTMLRVVGAMLLLGVICRPWRERLSRTDALAVARYGATLGVMNLLFYQSLKTLPLGLATAIEFTGPLTVAVVTSRRWTDFLWVGLAASGLLSLLPIWGNARGLDRTGMLFAFGAAACWALYIVFGKRVGHFQGGRAVALGMIVAAAIVTPVGLSSAGIALLKPSVLLHGLTVAALSSAIPYSLEMVALRRLPPQAFGVMLSMDPALGALIAFLTLGERLSVLQWAAVGSVMAASFGAALTAKLDSSAATQAADSPTAP